MYFLSGTYDHQIDAKNRIRIPSNLRGKEEKLYFTKGTDGCIFVYYEAVIKEKFAKLEEMKLNNPNLRMGARAFAYSVKAVDVDQQGRLVIPQELIQHANIVKDVKICGSGSKIEIWAKETLDNYMANSNFDENFDLLEI